MADVLSTEGRLRPGTGRRKLGRGPGGESGQMQNLLGEFKNLYEGRLKRLEDSEKSGEENTRVYILVLLFL